MKNIYILLFILLSCIDKESRSSSSKNQQSDSIPLTLMKTRKIMANDLKTGPGFSTPVISSAQKFIIPISAFKEEGEPLIYPEKHQKAGQPILDYEGKPIGKRGIVFFNAKDQAWQAAAGDGESVIIINEVTQQQAEQLDRKIREIQANPDDLTIIQLKQVLSYAQQQLDLNDMYNSSRSFIREKMTPVGSDKGTSSQGADDVYGPKKRDDRDINQAIYIPGGFLFEGPAASPQKFTDGGVIIEQGGKMRGIQPNIFVRTYTLANGSRIQSVAESIQSQNAN